MYVVAEAGGARLYYPAERADAPDWHHRFARDAPPPAPAEVIELDDVYLRNGRDWACLYDRDGRRIDATALPRYREDLTLELWRAAPTLPIPRNAPTVAQPVRYGGVFFNHWGHFLLESTARLWAKPALALPTVYTWFSAPRLPAIDAFLAEDPPLALDAPCVRLTKCFVASPSFAHEGYASPRHLAAPHEVARRLIGGGGRDPRPAYLSRGLVSAPLPGRARVRNEAELEARLVAAGVRILHLQMMDLAEQIAAINAHRVVIGLWGSAWHNLVFRLPGEAIETFVLVDDARKPANFRLVDGLIGARAHYLNTVRPAAEDLAIDVAATLAYLRAAGAIGCGPADPPPLQPSLGRAEGTRNSR